MINKVILVGYLYEHASVRSTNGGAPVADLCVVTVERWRGNDGVERERPEYHQVVIYGKRAADCRDLEKGAEVYIEGAIRTERYMDREGNEQSVKKVKADKIDFRRK